MVFTILLVEDDEQLRNLFVKFLETKDFNVLACDSVNGAKNLLAGDLEIQLVITDWNIIGGTGEEVIKKALAMGIAADHICVMTGFGITVDERDQNFSKARRLAPEAVLLTKPFRLKELDPFLTRL